MNLARAMTSHSTKLLPNKSDYMTSMHEHPLTENEDQPLEKSNKTKCPNTHCGCKMVFDNLVYAQEVHSMTGDHQTAIVIMSLQCRPKNRVPGTRFSTETPQSGLLEMENGNCLPSAPNIIILSGEINTSNLWKEL